MEDTVEDKEGLFSCFPNDKNPQFPQSNTEQFPKDFRDPMSNEALTSMIRNYLHVQIYKLQCLLTSLRETLSSNLQSSSLLSSSFFFQFSTIYQQTMESVLLYLRIRQVQHLQTITKLYSPDSNSSQTSGDPEEQSSKRRRCQPTSPLKQTQKPDFGFGEALLPTQSLSEEELDDDCKKRKFQRKEEGRFPFGCSFPGCLKRFPQSNSLKRHLRTHTGERPFVCKHLGCGKSFADRSNWKRHEDIHADLSFECPIPACGRSYSRRSTLQKHLLLHNREHEGSVSLTQKE